MRKEVDTSSNDWATVDYQLQLVTGKSSIKINSIYRLNDEPMTQHQYKTDAVINATDFGKEYIEKVVSKTVPLEDLIVYCGHVNIHPKAGPNKVFTFLLCRVALGKLGTPRQDVARLDSIFIESQVEINAFQYNFFLRSHAQYNVIFEANFTVGQDREFNSAQYQCASCQNKQATLFCRIEQLYFCQGCSLDHHRTRILQNHQLQKIDKINTLPVCKNHGQRFSNYCLRCQKYLCPGCLQKGASHGNNDHPVYYVHQLYQDKRQNNETLALKQREKLENLMRSLQLKREEVEENYRETRRFIQSQQDKALTILDDLLSQKLSSLNSDELELKMLNQRLEWSKAFIKFQEKSLKPIYYFQSQDRFEKDISRTKISQFESIFAVKGDIAAQGEIIVAKRDLLDRSRNMNGGATSRIDPTKQQRSPPSTNRSLYQYDANASLPNLGLFSILQNSKLNFFSLSK